MGNGWSSGPGWPQPTPAALSLLFRRCRPASITARPTAGHRFLADYVTVVCTDDALNHCLPVQGHARNIQDISDPIYDFARLT